MTTSRPNRPTAPGARRVGPLAAFAPRVAFAAVAALAACSRPLPPSDPEPAAAGASGGPEAGEAPGAAGHDGAPAARPDELARARAELRALRSDRDALAARVDELEAELARTESERIERELEWAGFADAFAELELDALVSDLGFGDARIGPPIPPELLEPTVPEPDPLLEARLERGVEVLRSLRALFALEHVRGLDPLELGQVHEGYAGPVVFRLLDGDGRLAGSLSAERLRLEGSRAGRVVTLVLEEGAETRLGVTEPFRRDVRRIQLPYVDPEDWIEAMPELFSPDDLTAATDDGRWQLDRVRGELNRLLRRDAAAGFYRLRHLGGVIEDVLRDVHLTELDADGATRRHLFADRLRVASIGHGVQLTLEDGVSMRGDDKAPFLEGRYRIFLPRAVVDDWRAARIPGLVPADGRAPDGPDAAAVDDARRAGAAEASAAR